MEIAISHLPKLWVTDSTINALCHGHNLAIPGISKLHSKIKENDIVAIFSLKDELIALGNALLSSEDIMGNEKGLAVNIHKVIMKPELNQDFKNNYLLGNKLKTPGYLSSKSIVKSCLFLSYILPVLNTVYQKVGSLHEPTAIFLLSLV